jgi:hypothetical protein
MKLLDEDNQRWICYKDDEVFLGNEQRWVTSKEDPRAVPPSTYRISIRGLCGMIPVDRKWKKTSGSEKMPFELPDGTSLGALKYALPGALYVTQNELLCYSSEISITREGGWGGPKDLGKATYFVEYSLTPNTEVSLAPIKLQVPNALAITIQPLEFREKPYALQILSVHSRLAGKLDFRALSLSGYAKGTLLGDGEYQQLKSSVESIRNQIGQKTRVY